MMRAYSNTILASTVVLLVGVMPAVAQDFEEVSTAFSPQALSLIHI